MQTVLKVVVFDGQGVMDRVLGIIRRFGCNIGSIAAGEVEEGVYDISIAFRTMGMDVEALGRRLSELDCVRSWENYNLETGFMREMIIGKTSLQQWDAMAVGGLRQLEARNGEMFFEYTGTPEQVGEMMKRLRELHVTCTRTGPVCLGLSEQKEQCVDGKA